MHDYSVSSTSYGGAWLCSFINFTCIDLVLHLRHADCDVVTNHAYQFLVACVKLRDLPAREIPLDAPG